MKIKRFNITAQALRKLFGAGLRHCEVERNAIPKNAELVRIAVDEKTSSVGQIALFFTSESFPDVPEATMLEGEQIWIKEYFPIEEQGFYCAECDAVAHFDPYNPNYLVCDCLDRKQIDPNGPFPEKWSRVLIQKIIKDVV